jgi:GxxExxY protein
MESRVTALDVSHDVITAAMKVHSALGPGLLESVYEVCLAHELRKVGHRCETQVALPVRYDGEQLDAGFRIDLLVGDLVFVELKSVEKIHPVCHAQLISYLRLSGKSLGLLINFNVPHLRDGIKRFVWGNEWKKAPSCP